MKLKFKILSLALLIAITSCDQSMVTNVNGDKVYSINDNCGRIDFRASYFTGVIGISQSLYGNDFVIKPKSLVINAFPKETFEITDLEFRDGKGKAIFQDSIVSNGEYQLHISVRIKVKTGYTGKKGIVISPSDFLMCENKPILKDTIKVGL